MGIAIDRAATSEVQENWPKRPKPLEVTSWWFRSGPPRTFFRYVYIYIAMLACTPIGEAAPKRLASTVFFTAKCAFACSKEASNVTKSLAVATPGGKCMEVMEGEIWQVIPG